jgi:RHS repeat-associated protein
VIVNPRYATQQRQRAPETANAAFCDEVSGLRYYNPSTGRWLNRDPIKENGEVSLYGFVHNNPTCHIDNFGKQIATQVVDQGIISSVRVPGSNNTEAGLTTLAIGSISDTWTTAGSGCCYQVSSVDGTATISFSYDSSPAHAKDHELHHVADDKLVVSDLNMRLTWLTQNRVKSRQCISAIIRLNLQIAKADAQFYGDIWDAQDYPDPENADARLTEAE